MTPNGVNTTLTANRRTRPIVENDSYAAFSRRVIAAHGRRVAAGDVEGLAELLNLARDLDRALHTAVTSLRTYGYSWTDIATRAAITRQAAQQRWAAHPNETTTTDPTTSVAAQPTASTP